MIILVSVDDCILIAYRKEEDLNSVKRELIKDFELKDLGKVHYCLGIEIRRNRNQPTLNIWWRFLEEMGVKTLKTVPILNENRGAQLVAKNPVFYSRSKHIHVNTTA